MGIIQIARQVRPRQFFRKVGLGIGRIAYKRKETRAAFNAVAKAGSALINNRLGKLIVKDFDKGGIRRELSREFKNTDNSLLLIRDIAIMASYALTFCSFVGLFSTVDGAIESINNGLSLKEAAHLTGKGMSWESLSNTYKGISYAGTALGLLSLYLLGAMAKKTVSRE